MATRARRIFTPDEYLALERAADYKSEYYSGEIYSMAGASRAHNLIVANVTSAFVVALRGRPCEAYANDMKVRGESTGAFTYPDVVVVCGEPRFLDDHGDVLTNPTVIVEVLSESTEAHDRGEKFAHYRRIESLQEYVLVSQSRRRVERFARQDVNHWLLSETSEPDAVVALPSIGCDLRLADIYDKVAS